MKWFRLKVTVAEGYLPFSQEVGDWSWYERSVTKSSKNPESFYFAVPFSAALVYMVLGGLALPLNI